MTNIFQNLKEGEDLWFSKLGDDGGCFNASFVEYKASKNEVVVRINDPACNENNEVNLVDSDRSLFGS